MKYTPENVMTRIGQIMENKNFHTMEIAGYKHIETVLRLHYDDCDEVFIFTWNGTEDMIIESYYVGDYINDGTRPQKAQEFKEHIEKLKEKG